jgi:hypothetical protein
MGQRDRRGGENTLRREKSVWKLETPILGELISPKSFKIPRRIQEIANEGLGVALTIETLSRIELEEK